MKTNPNDLLNAPQEYKKLPDKREISIVASGLTKREYFAALAMQGYLSISGVKEETMAFVTKNSVLLADTLIKSLNENIK